MYILADINELVENQDLCRNKEDFWNILETTKILFFNVKDFILLGLSVKKVYVVEYVVFKKSVTC